MASFPPPAFHSATDDIPHNIKHIDIQEWSDARSHFDHSPSAIITERFAASAVTTSRDPSPARTAPIYNPSIHKSPGKSHKKSSSIPSPTTRRRTHVRKLSGLPKSPTVPTFHAHSPSTETASTTSTPLVRANSNTQVTRSPSRKKAPAYHSSYGVETELGPPPSYSTQRTLSQDRVRKVDVTNRTTGHIEEQPHPLSQELDIRSSQAQPTATSTLVDQNPGLSPSEFHSSPETLDTPSIDTPTLEQSASMGPPSLSSYGITIREDDPDATIRGLGVKNIEQDSRGSSSDERKSEDLFLNIARQNGAPPPDTAAKTERRRSRISLPFMSSNNNRPTSSSRRETQRPDTFDPEALTPKNEYVGRPPSFGFQSSAVSTHPSESGRQRYFSSTTRDTPSAVPSSVGRDSRGISPEARVLQRRYSNANSQSAGLGANRTQRYGSETLSPKFVEHTQTESTISTTAPSTVWDELDDLKSRIRKLELTGKLPSSSAAAMSSVERPRTATTTVTTMSSSPKHNKNIGMMPSAIEGVPSTVHPLLHEALGKAQGTVNHEVYQKLQATALEALQLTSMMGGGSQSSNAAAMGIAPSAERQIRRRADEMCRNLTELAIALAADSRPVPSPASAPRDVFSGHVSRRLSNEPSERPSGIARATSRIESRRASLRLGESRMGLPSPAEPSTSSVVSHNSQPSSSSRIQRTSTVLRNRRAQGYDGAADEEESPLPRPVSRAQTDSGASRRAARDSTNFSREYTSQHPLPFQVPKVESRLESRLAVPSNTSSYLRRKYVPSPGIMTDNDTSSSPIPVTPREGFARISVIGRQSLVGLTSADVTPENVTVQRGSGGTRRSLGLAGRIGSSVGSRLRAVRAERYATGNGKVKEMGIDGQNENRLTKDRIDDTGVA